MIYLVFTSKSFDNAADENKFDTEISIVTLSLKLTCSLRITYHIVSLSYPNIRLWFKPCLILHYQWFSYISPSSLLSVYMIIKLLHVRDWDVYTPLPCSVILFRKYRYQITTIVIRKSRLVLTLSRQHWVVWATNKMSKEAKFKH